MKKQFNVRLSDSSMAILNEYSNEILTKTDIIEKALSYYKKVLERKIKKRRKEHPLAKFAGIDKDNDDILKFIKERRSSDADRQRYIDEILS